MPHFLRHGLVLLNLLAITTCDKPAPQKNHHETAVTQTKEAKITQEKPGLVHGMEKAAQIANLIDPAKLATLGERGANSRVQKITAILWSAKSAGKNPEEITRDAVRKIGWGGTLKGDLTAAAILRNLDIAEKLGSTTPQDIAAMKKGNAATVRKGPYSGDSLSVDHIIPRAVAPELDNVICNLELMPLRMNKSKNDSIGVRQRSLAKQLHAAGLLTNPELPD